MTMDGLWLKIDGKRVGPALEEALAQLEGVAGEVTLDLSSVTRIDATALRALERLAAIPHERITRIVLLGVNVDAYKVLKLVKLGPRFSFLP